MNWFWPGDAAIEHREAPPAPLLHASPDTWGLNFFMRYRVTAESEAPAGSADPDRPESGTRGVDEADGNVIVVDFPGWSGRARGR